MSFRDFSATGQGVQLLRRSLARGRLGHAHLFTGDTLKELEIRRPLKPYGFAPRRHQLVPVAHYRVAWVG